MVADSAKKTEEELEQKRQCHRARLAFQRGKRGRENDEETELAKKYATGELREKLAQAETAYTRKKHIGVARLLEPP